MQNQLKEQRCGRSASLYLLAVIVVALGVFFRFANLEKKFYKHDETRTSLRISGHTVGEMKRGILNRGEIAIQDLHKYQRINPEKGLLYTIYSLAVDDPKHPPLYYTLARLWAQLFGDVRFHFRDPPDFKEGDHLIERSEATKRFYCLA